MDKHNQGYGICGAKNIYSSQVKLDNWVEDRIGGDLAANYNAPKKHLYETNTMRSYGPPDMNLLASQPVLNIPSTQELKAKNKEGMPYSLLFDHGTREITPDDRFTTMSMLTVMKPSEKFHNSQQDKVLERQKSKKMMRDINLSYVKTTEQRMANAHVSYTPQTSDLATGKSSDLPNFHRHRPLTITFPQFNQ